MGAAYFYHLTRQPLEVTLPALLEKSLQAGWRIYVRGLDDERLKWLDDKLWLVREDSFLPHGVEGGAHDTDQPILLGTGTKAANAANCLICIDGADVSAEEVQSAERVSILFDGNSEEAVAKARAQWKSLVDAECSAQYWSEEGGSWQKKAER